MSKKIINSTTKVDFGPEQESLYGITGLKQWDQGQKLEISGLDISDEIVEVHFSLQEFQGTAKRMVGTVVDGVIHTDIPVFILEGPEYIYGNADAYSAYAWIYLSDDESAETIRKMEFEIKARPKPDDYVTPDEISFLQQLEQAMKNKLDKSGYAPDKYLGTDDQGNVVEKDAPEGTGNNPIIATRTGELVDISDSANAKPKNIRLYGKSTQNGTPSIEIPQPINHLGENGSIVVKICRKNFIDISKITNGNSLTNEDGVLIWTNNYATMRTTIGNICPDLKVGDTVILSAKTENMGNNNGIHIIEAGKNWHIGESLTITESILNSDVWFYLEDTTKAGKMWDIQIELGTSVSSYEPYEEPQVLTVSTPNGLKGIGDVRDYVDYERRKYVQRVGVIKSYNGEEVGEQYLSTTGELSKGAYVIYALEEPIETDLTEEEMEQYNALVMNYPSTTIINSDNALMEVEYIADTKNYVDGRPMAEIEADLSGYVKKEELGNYATKGYVEEEIANFDFIKIVTELPTQGLPNRTYLVAKSDVENNDLYDEYLWVNDKWEFVGTKTIDVELIGYAKTEDLPTKTSQLQNDSGFIGENAIINHNTSETSHNDIRLLIAGLSARLNALADSDDTTLDQMSEIVAYIKANKNLIDSVTTSKVNVTDIIDNLETSVSNKPLSAKQGVLLKALIDSIVVPTKTSQLQNDSGFVESPATAEVGQVLVVKAVDENGVPTEWEVSDVASGGEAEYILAKTVTLENDVNTITITTDDDGNDLNFSEGFIIWDAAKHTAKDNCYVNVGKNGAQISMSLTLVNTFSVHATIKIERMGDFIEVSTSLPNSANVGSYYTNCTSYLTKIDTINYIQFKTAVAPSILAGTTIKLYTRR